MVEVLMLQLLTKMYGSKIKFDRFYLIHSKYITLKASINVTVNLSLLVRESYYILTCLVLSSTVLETRVGRITNSIVHDAVLAHKAVVYHCFLPVILTDTKNPDKLSF